MTGRVAKNTAAEAEAVASVVQRLAVLLAAGVAPASAWGYLAEAEGSAVDTVLARVAASIARGDPIDDAIHSAAIESAAIDGAVNRSVVNRSVGDSRGGGSSATGSETWRGLAAAWRVATDAGAPLAPTLNDLAVALRDLAQTSREVQVALAAPIATARMVMALPAIGVLFGLALGFDTLGTLFTTPLGLGCLVCGLLLMVAARAWNRRLVRASGTTGPSPGLMLDLVAIAVSGGASIDRASAAVAEACRRSGLPVDQDEAVIESVLWLSKRAGVPAGRLLRSEAEEARRRARSEGARKAATLSVMLMLPLGLCILPAFMVLGVAPLLIAVISSTVAGF